MTGNETAKTTLRAGDSEYEIYRLDRIATKQQLERLPYSLKVLLENLLRHQDEINVTQQDIDSLLNRDPDAEPSEEIAFTPARVLLQDLTGVPGIVDLAAMRDAMRKLGSDPDRINPLSPVELVIDHSIQVDESGHANALLANSKIEFERNFERYGFLRWGQKAFSNFAVVPPATGICHQVNLEYLARVVFPQESDGVLRAYPDTLVGADSHTTMINGLGVLGWGVGGIEAEACMLGQPVSMLVPRVVGFKLVGSLREGTTATDLVLQIVKMLRNHGVVGSFVEFFGDGLTNLPLADRATIANMAPEYGATCGIFPIDTETLRFLQLTGRSEQQIALVEQYARAQGMFREDGAAVAEYSSEIELDLGAVEPSIAGPSRPQDQIKLTEAKDTIAAHLEQARQSRSSATGKSVTEVGKARVRSSTGEYDLVDGALVIAAITSCTNTSNPSVMLGAGLLARSAVEKGLKVKPWVKTSLAPGSTTVAGYLKNADLLEPLEQLGFQIVGYGCTTCIGNSGPLAEPISKAIRAGEIITSSVLSGNRNFEGRVHPEVRMNFLASPPLVVAYALAGRTNIDLYSEPLGEDQQGEPVFLADIWPGNREVADTIAANIDAATFRSSYADVYRGDEQWRNVQVPEGAQYRWDDTSTYIANPPYFSDMTREVKPLEDISQARVLALLGDSITTDHISPAGAFSSDTPAGQYLMSLGIAPRDFNSYGSRRGNHEVMVRGTFANVRLRNKLAPGTEGGWTAHQPSGEKMWIYEASQRYQNEKTPLMVLGGANYGTGSSRDWAAKGPLLLGVKVVLVESFERIHRSNLVGMGILPLEFEDGQNVESLGLDGTESFSISGIAKGVKRVDVVARYARGDEKSFAARVRIDTPKEWEYFVNGGILHYVIRQLAA